MREAEAAEATAEPTIRFGAATDFEDVRRHWALVQDAHAAHMPDTFRPMEASDLPVEQLYGYLDNPWLLLIAELEGAIAGSLLASVQAANGQGGYLPARNVHVWHVLTEPQLRRRGVARALIAAAAEWGATQQADRVDLAVWSFNSDALALYRRLGFATAHIGMTIVPSDALARLGGGRLPERPALLRPASRWRLPKWLRRS
jgi:ribosomal protein S18 acetylase RimI-like enzyme